MAGTVASDEARAAAPKPAARSSRSTSSRGALQPSVRVVQRADRRPPRSGAPPATTVGRRRRARDTRGPAARCASRRSSPVPGPARRAAGEERRVDISAVEASNRSRAAHLDDVVLRGRAAQRRHHRVRHDREPVRRRVHGQPDDGGPLDGGEARRSIRARSVVVSIWATTAMSEPAAFHASRLSVAVIARSVRPESTSCHCAADDGTVDVDTGGPPRRTDRVGEPPPRPPGRRTPTGARSALRHLLGAADSTVPRGL